MNLVKDLLRKIRGLFNPKTPQEPTEESAPDITTSTPEVGKLALQDLHHPKNEILEGFIEQIEHQKKLFAKVYLPKLSHLDVRIGQIKNLHSKIKTPTNFQAGSDFWIPFESDFSELDKIISGGSTLARFNIREAERKEKLILRRKEIESDLVMLEEANSTFKLTVSEKLIRKLTLSIDQSEADLFKRLDVARNEYFRRSREADRIRRDTQRRESEEKERRRANALLLKREKEEEFRKNLFELDTRYYYEMKSKTGSLRLFDVLKSRKDFGLRDRLKRGLALLDGDQEMRQYLYSYGLGHAEKLIQAFRSFINSSMVAHHVEDIEVFDWGCGQGIGTLALIDTLRVNNISFGNIRSVTLIEPGLSALRRAALNVSLALDDERRVRPVNKFIDSSIGTADLSCARTTTKYHIFSNIVDVDGFDPDTVAGLLIEMSPGVNYIVCVGPLFGDGHLPVSKDKKMDYFTAAFKYHCDLEIITKKENGSGWVYGRNWTRKEYILRVTIP
jgi:hypothetical protein